MSSGERYYLRGQLKRKDIRCEPLPSTASATQAALRDDIPEPHAGDNELLVRVHASSVNPVDVFIAAGAVKEMAEHEFPLTLGRDFAGVVEEVGSGVSGYGAGDEVFGFVRHVNPAVHTGAGRS